MSVRSPDMFRATTNKVSSALNVIAHGPKTARNLTSKLAAPFASFLPLLQLILLGSNLRGSYCLSLWQSLPLAGGHRLPSLEKIFSSGCSDGVCAANGNAKLHGWPNPYSSVCYYRLGGKRYAKCFDAVFCRTTSPRRGCLCIAHSFPGSPNDDKTDTSSALEHNLSGYDLVCEEEEVASETAAASASASEAASRAALDFARLCGRLKSTPRTGWLKRSIPRPESVADHSWRVSALTFLVVPSDEARKDQTRPNIDARRCLEMAVVHDLAESIVGDIAPSDGVSAADKRRMEHDAMDRISDVLRNATSSEYAKRYLLDLFDEYEGRETPEAKTVKDLDLLDMIVQADEYERDAVLGDARTNSHARSMDLDLSGFFDGTPPEKFYNPELRAVATELHRQRELRLINTSGKKLFGDEDGSCAQCLSNEDAAFVENLQRACPR